MEENKDICFKFISIEHIFLLVDLNLFCIISSSKTQTDPSGQLSGSRYSPHRSGKVASSDKMSWNREGEGKVWLQGSTASRKHQGYVRSTRIPSQIQSHFHSSATAKGIPRVCPALAHRTPQAAGLGQLGFRAGKIHRVGHEGQWSNGKVRHHRMDPLRQGIQ